jgi:hypothetical protein
MQANMGEFGDADWDCQRARNNRPLWAQKNHLPAIAYQELLPDGDPPVEYFS